MNRYLALAVGVVLLGCSGEPPRSLEGAPELALELVEPARAEPEEPVEMIGVLTPVAEVTLVAPGFARLATIEVELGDRVAADELVAVMDLRSERSELASATAAWKAARAERERLELELEQARAERADVEQLEDFVSAAELRERRHAEQLAAARQRSADATLSQQRSHVEAAAKRVSEAELRAPFAAEVAHRYVDPGATLTAGEPIVALISEARRVRFAVPEQHGARLRLGAPVVIGFGDAGVDIHGEVSAIAPEIDPATRLVFAEARLDGEVGSLRIGAVARVRFLEPLNDRRDESAKIEAGELDPHDLPRRQR
jgi:membrane fusion protein, multidrug efflux system